MIYFNTTQHNTTARYNRYNTNLELTGTHCRRSSQAPLIIFPVALYIGIGARV
jgi:hypothetical protein